MKLWAISLRQSVDAPEPRLFFYADTAEEARSQAQELLNDSWDPSESPEPCEITRVECVTEETMKSELSPGHKKETKE